MIRGIRGATTVEVDEIEQVLEETNKLVKQIILNNNIHPNDVASVIISASPDIKSGFPAKAVRLIEGWKYVPILCTNEMDVCDALKLCIRVLVHVNTTVPQENIHHVYLNEASVLRPDLAYEDEIEW